MIASEGPPACDRTFLTGVSSFVDSHHIDPPTDSAIIGRVLAGEVQAYTALVARYRDRYARFAVHMLGNREDAEEALQDAFVRAFRGLPTCEDPERFGPWFFRILVNRCRTTGARRGRRERVLLFDDVAMRHAAVEHSAEGAAWRDEIRIALGRLDEAGREAFLLKYVEDLSYEEMERLTGVGISALKMRVKRACSRLREMLREVRSA
ncbi:MAG: RNA polymerase sigma factor [Gemmatimonadota bacterium]|nr:RNA polymerase sigma factor [Gemmatimonadota bacterium]